MNTSWKLLALANCLTVILTAQHTASISGHISDSETGLPLAGANVLIKDTYSGTASDNNGNFKLTHLAPGQYTLVITMMGYQKIISRPLTVNENINETVNFQMLFDVLASPQVVVTASRKVQDIMEAPVAVTVLGQRQIMNKAATTLEEVLPYQAGISIVKDQINIRGANSYSLGAGNRSLLLLDGVPLLGSAAGNITWAVVPTSEIARVEVVKSSGSAQYGSGAMGGVINIITRNTPAQPETRVQLKAGQYSEPKYHQWHWRSTPGRFHNLEISHARPFGSHGFWLRLQQRQTDSYYLLGWKDALNLTGKLKLNFGSRYNATLFANLLADRSGISSLWKNPAAPFDAPTGYEDDTFTGTKMNLSGSMNIIYSPDVIMKLRSSYYHVHWQNSGLTNNDRSLEQKLFAEYQVATNWGQTLNTTAGMVAQRASIDARIFGEHSTYSGAVYFLLQKRLIAPLNLSLGGRYESYWVDDDLLDQTLSPQIAVNYNPSPLVALRASLGHGFRVPTVAELFSQSQLSVFKIRPNRNLVVETSLSSEVGGTLIMPGKGAVSALKLDASFFSTSYRQMIEPVIFRADTIHFENITDALVTGAELSLSGSFFDNLLTAGVAYTWLDPLELDQDGAVTDTLSYRFRHSLSTQSTVTWKNFSCVVEYRFASRMDRVELFQENDKTGADRRVPVHIYNIGFGYQVNNLEFRLRVENLLQYYYVDLERNMGPERSLSLQATYSF